MPFPKIKQTLSLLGLSEIEITVYLDLLKLGSAPASLIARRLKLNRSTTRYTLENLCKKRFGFQENRNGGFYFNAEDPEKILLLLRSNQRELEAKETAVSQIIGDLRGLKNPHINTPKVRFFEGVDGIIKMYEDVLADSLKTNCTIYGYLHYDESDFHPKFKKFLQNRYIPERSNIKNKAFMIFNDVGSDRDYAKKDLEMNRVTLFVPVKDFPLSTCFHIYGDKIAFYSYTEGQPPSGVIIKHETIVKDHLNLFRMAWDFAKNLPINDQYKNATP